MDQNHNSKIKRTALDRACEELARKHRTFRQLSDDAYAYSMPEGAVNGQQHFTVEIGGRAIIFARREAGDHLFHIPPYSSKAECLGIIRTAMRQVDAQLEMQRAIAEDKAQGKLL